MIIYFSGTGNSRLVAHELQRQRPALGAPFELSASRLLKPQDMLLEAAEDEDVVWVFPIYSWGVPPVVLGVIDKVRFRGAESARHYMVCTCGDDIGRADDMWRKHIGRRGWSPRGVFSVQMPNTYVCMKGFDVDPKDVEAGKLTAMPLRVSEIVGKINRRFAGDDVVRGSWGWWKTNLIYPFFVSGMTPAKFRSDPDTCTSCGLCARSCPMLNITMTETKVKGDGSGKDAITKRMPKWSYRCADCLRCYHVCPTHSVAYGRATLDKGQYLAPRIKNGE